MKAVVRDGNNFLGTYYVYRKVSSGSDIIGFEMDLLRIILQQMNMTFVYVPTPECFELEEGSVNILVIAMFAKETYIALGSVTRISEYYSSFDTTNTHFFTRIRWYVPRSEKY